MTEVINSSSPTTFTESLVLDGHALYRKDSDTPVPVDAIYHHLLEGGLGDTTLPPRIEDLDLAYDMRRIKYARQILARLTRYEPYSYSSGQNRIALNDLAHPMHRYLAIKEFHGTVKPELTKDIEAVYGRGGDQLGFLLAQLEEHAEANAALGADIEGGLSELTFFLLTARQLTDEDTNPYLIIPSTSAQDNARVTGDHLHHGYDFTVIRQSDNTHIPVQVKTRTTHLKSYPEEILIISIADLVNDNYATPRMLAEAMYFEVSGAQNFDETLIDAASKRLFAALDTYPAAA